tara:strand:- start:3428 stop:3655 length:228 start_codon:yes stop_codon:yes gene_type:complete
MPINKYGNLFMIFFCSNIGSLTRFINSIDNNKDINVNRILFMSKYKLYSLFDLLPAYVKDANDIEINNPTFLRFV